MCKMNTCAALNKCPYSAPCPCDLVTLSGNFPETECLGILDTFKDPIRLGQIYTVGYNFLQESDLIFAGVVPSVQSDINQWFIKLVIAIFIPTFLVFLTLFIILINSGLVSFDVGYLLIGLTLFIMVLAIFWIVWDTSYVVDQVDTTIRTKITDNISKNRNELINIFGCAYSTCVYDNSTTGFLVCNVTSVPNTDPTQLLPYGTCNPINTSSLQSDCLNPPFTIV